MTDNPECRGECRATETTHTVHESIKQDRHFEKIVWVSKKHTYTLYSAIPLLDFYPKKNEMLKWSVKEFS